MLRRERFSGQRPRLAARLVVARVHGLSLVGCGCGLSSRKTRAPVGLAWLRLSWGVAGGDAAKARRKAASTSEALSPSPACAASPARQLPLPVALRERTPTCSTPGSIAASTQSALRPLRCPCVGSATGSPYRVGGHGHVFCLLTLGPVRSLMRLRPVFNQRAN